MNEKSQQIVTAIERVADKRHARLCAKMQESDAAGHVVAYLQRMETIYKDCPSIKHYVSNIKAGYQAGLAT